MDRMESILKELETLSLPALCAQWMALLGEPPPATHSAVWLRCLLAWKLQEAINGGIPAPTKRQLVRLANAYEKDDGFSPATERELTPGTVLSREWKGVRHRVRVLPDGFEYAEHRYRSLSEVARVIAGTRWSGPRFFGLDASQISRVRS